MNDKNKLPKQSKPQEFELVELLFQEYISSHIARPDIEYSFQARFQSFIDQIPSYLHSVSKTGFFTHFFFGSFTSLLDTQLAGKLVLKKLHFNFESVDHLRIVAETNDKMHVFIFTENNKNKKQKKNKDIGFTQDEWKTITGREYTEDDNKKLKISVIQINKSTGSINVTVEKKDIQDGSSSTKQYHEITKQFVDQDGQYVVLEDQISLLSDVDVRKINVPLQDILRYIKKIHDHYQGLPYGDKAREADEHGFVAGIFNNFRYRENAHVYLEQFAGKGYADMVLLVRGSDRTTKSIPIIMEFKAGTGAGTNYDDALKQVEEYTKGFQPNNMRILSLADNLLCVGMNLDSPSNAFMKMKVVDRDQEAVPLIQSLTDSAKKTKDINIDIIKQEIQSNLEKTYNTFPGTGEKSSAHYMSRFLLGESLVLKDYDKHVFVYNKESQIPTATVIDDHGTRSKKPKIEKIVDDSNAVNSILFIPTSSADSPVILVNIIDVNRDVVVNNIRLDNGLIGNRKIVQLNIQFNIDKYKESFAEYCKINLLKDYGSISEYNKASVEVKGQLYLVSEEVSDNLSEHLQQAISSQEGLVISEHRYKELLDKIGAIVYPMKSLINRESEFQGLLEGIFKYYSDASLSEGAERRALVFTEFQTGAGGRIDMLMQAIGPSEQGSKEYIPVGLELKYDDSIKLDARGRKQDQNIQQILLAREEQHVVEKLLHAQMERYSKGAVIKSITDGNKVAIMGIVFNAQAKHPNKLLLSNDKFLEADIVHSSKVYSISDGIMVPNINDLPPPESEAFIPDWIEQETIDTLAKMQGEDQALLSLFNKGLDDNKIRKLQNSLKGKGDIRSIDGLNLSYNDLTANGIKILTEILGTKLIYLDLSDNDLAKDNFVDFKELIQQIKVPILKISDIGMNNKQMRETIALLKKQDQVSHLEIQHLESQRMDDETAHSIGKYISNTNMLDYLSLSDCGIENIAAGIIANSLRVQHTLRSLILSKNNIGAEATKSFKTHLPKSGIGHLDLSGNPLGIDGFANIVEGVVSSSSNVKVIKLVDVGVKYNRDSRVQEERLTNAIQSLFSNKKLTSIDISYNDIGTGLLSQTFNILSKAVDDYSLRDVSLEGNKIDWGSHLITINTLKARIGKFFEQNKTIRSLNMAYMDLDDELGTEIAKGFEKSFLIHLDLSGNINIDKETISALCESLRSHQYLKYLNLSDTKQNIKNIKDLLSAVRLNKDLTHINLSNNDLSEILSESNGNKILDLDNQYIDFKSLLKGNTSLKYLNLSHCQLNSDSLKSLFALVKENSSLTVLNIRGNILDDTIVDDIVKALIENEAHGLNGLKQLYIDKSNLSDKSVSKLKSLGVSVLVEDYVPQDMDLIEEINQTCTTSLDKNSFQQSADQYDHTTLESATEMDQYNYWLQQHDIPDIARVHYRYSEGELEVVGDAAHLSAILNKYRSSGNIHPFTIILNLGGNHWVSLVLHRVNNCYHAYYADSSGNSIVPDIVEVLNNNRMLIHDISIMQQSDNHNCGLWALENASMIRHILQANDNIRLYDPNSLSLSYSNHDFISLRRDIAFELRHDVLRQDRLVTFNLIPEPEEISHDSQRWTIPFSCFLLPTVSRISQQKYKRDIIDDDIMTLVPLDEKFLNCVAHIPPHIVGYKLIKLMSLGILSIDNESCGIFAHLRDTFYAALYSKMRGVDIDVLYSKMHEALLSNDINKLRNVVNNEVKDLYTLEKITRSAFVIDAVKRLDIQSTRFLIEKGANVHQRDVEGNTALYYAIQQRDYEIVKLLISYGRSINVANNMTAIELATKIKDTSIIRLLLQNGSNIDGLSNDSDMVLHKRIKSNNTELSKLLIRAESDVNATDSGGNTQLILATTAKNQNDNGDSVIPKIAVGAGVVGVAVGAGIAGGKILGIVSGVGTGSVVRTPNRKEYSKISDSSDDETLDRRSELNVVDSAGNTLLHNAIIRRDVEMVEFYVNNGVSINSINNQGDTPLHVGINGIRYRGNHRTTRNIKQDISDSNDEIKTIKIIAILVKHNADVSIQNNNGDTALHLAVQKMNKTVIELLLSLVNEGSMLLCIKNNNGSTIVKLAFMSKDDGLIGCFVNFHDKIGNSLLHSAVINDEEAVFRRFLGYHADVNLKNNDGNAPLHLIVKKDHIIGTRLWRVQEEQHMMIDALKSYGANLNVQDQDGNTALHLLVKTNSILILRHLLELYDSNVNVQNADGKTALHYAVIPNNDVPNNKPNHLFMVSLLIKHGAKVDMQDKDGNTALDYANKFITGESVSNYLIEYGAHKGVELSHGGEISVTLSIKAVEYTSKSHAIKQYNNNVDILKESRLNVVSDYDTDHHRHRHHHGEWRYKKAAHQIDKRHTDDHHRGHQKDIAATLKIHDNQQYDKLVAAQEDIRYDAIVQAQHDMGRQHTIVQDTSKFIGSNASPIDNSVNNQLGIDWQGNLLLGRLLFGLFGKKCGGVNCKMTQDVSNDPVDSEYAHRLAYSSYAPVIGDNAEYTE